MTFTEAHALTDEYRKGQAREDRRAALTAMVLANVHRDPDKQREGWDLDAVVSWLGHGFQREPRVPEPPPAQTPAMIAAQVELLHSFYSQNGQHESGRDGSGS